jgi:2-keto-4-pentenoate hydratase
MKLTTFTYHGTTRPGVVIGDEILDAATVPDLPQDMIGLLEAGAPALDRLLEPGDIISTGTCSGVGVKMTPCGYLKVGDRVRVEIDGIGYIENPIVEEPADTVRL